MKNKSKFLSLKTVNYIFETKNIIHHNQRPPPGVLACDVISTSDHCMNLHHEKNSVEGRAATTPILQSRTSMNTYFVVFSSDHFSQTRLSSLFTYRFLHTQLTYTRRKLDLWCKPNLLVPPKEAFFWFLIQTNRRYESRQKIVSRKLRRWKVTSTSCFKRKHSWWGGMQEKCCIKRVLETQSKVMKWKSDEKSENRQSTRRKIYVKKNAMMGKYVTNCEKQRLS